MRKFGICEMSRQKKQMVLVAVVAASMVLLCSGCSGKDDFTTLNEQGPVPKGEEWEASDYAGEENPIVNEAEQNKQALLESGYKNEYLSKELGGSEDDGIIPWTEEEPEVNEEAGEAEENKDGKDGKGELPEGVTAGPSQAPPKGN